MKRNIAVERQKRLIAVVRKKGIIRSAEVEKAGISRVYLRRLVAKGELESVGRGLYALPGTLKSESRQLAEVAARIPQGVICLLSALQFHGLTTQMPHEMWIAIKSPGWRPRLEYPAIRVVWLSGKSFNTSIEEHKIEKVPVKVYGPAKTVADCFKFRNKIGIDVCVEALREVRRKKLATIDDLWKAAQVNRITNIIRPYLEAIS
jgi:predicted transcriptional regulator of viral defense system